MKEKYNKDKLLRAQRVKNDEFYTYLYDIDKELQHYKEQLKNKIIYCNCDGPKSNFVKYFKENFKRLQLKELIYSSDDFNKPENIDKLKRADIVITNPPFSKMKEYLTLLFKYNKKFLFIGPFLLITTLFYFERFLEKKIWGGYNYINNFFNNESETKNVAAQWFTNLPVDEIRRPALKLTAEYNPIKYPKFENYDAIDVGSIKEIPKDYYGEMGVSVKIFHWNYKEYFTIIGKDNTLPKKPLKVKNEAGKISNRDSIRSHFYVERKVDERSKRKQFINCKTGKLIKECFTKFIIKRK